MTLPGLVEIASVPEEFLDALAARDFDRLGSLMGPGVRFRALIPSGVAEEGTPSGVGNRFKEWFGDVDGLRVVRREVEPVSDRVRLSYRLRFRTAKGERVAEQYAFLTVADGKVSSINLLCSGFRPASEDE